MDGEGGGGGLKVGSLLAAFGKSLLSGFIRGHTLLSGIATFRSRKFMVVYNGNTGVTVHINANIKFPS